MNSEQAWRHWRMALGRCLDTKNKRKKKTGSRIRVPVDWGGCVCLDLQHKFGFFQQLRSVVHLNLGLLQARNPLYILKISHFMH